MTPKRKAEPGNRFERLVSALADGKDFKTGLGLVLPLAAIPAALALIQAFSNPYLVQDDARQFLFWMARWDDPTLFHNDLVADYWRSVSPWVFSAIYRAVDLMGVAPLTAAKLFPPILILATAYFAYRLSFTLTGHVPSATIGTILVLLSVITEDDLFSATPRAFDAPLFLAVLDGLVRKRIVFAAVAQLALAGIYPSLAMVTLGVSGLSALTWEKGPSIDFTKERWLMIGAVLAATIIGVGPVLLEIGRYGPTVLLEQARAMPTFQYGGRTMVFNADGSLDRLCGVRVGLGQTPVIFACNGFGDPLLYVNLLTLVLPLIFLFVHGLKHSKNGQSALKSQIYLYVLIVGALGFAAAHMALFKLYLPNRYIGKPMLLMLPLAAGHIIGLFVRGPIRRLASRQGEDDPAKKAIFYCVWVGGFVLFALAGFSATHIAPNYRRPLEPRLIATIAAHPTSEVVAGFVPDVDFVPVLARRTALFTREHAIPYHLGYYRQIETRMKDMIAAEFTVDPALLARLLEKWSVNIYLVSKQRLNNPDQRTGYNEFMPEVFAQASAGRQGRQTALAALAPKCTLATFAISVMLDASCLIREARTDANPPQQ